MESPLSVTYHQDESRADVRVDPVAGGGFALGVKSPPRAIMCWRDSGGGRSNAHLLDPAHHVFATMRMRAGSRLHWPSASTLARCRPRPARRASARRPLDAHAG